jgi:hypothetical protein
MAAASTFACGTCKSESEDFSKSQQRNGGRCRPCNKSVAKAWREANPEQYGRVSRNATYKRKYGITLDEYDAMWSVQNGTCLICDEHHDRLFVDHDHATGEVRGLLCNQCNLCLGHARDTPELLRKAATYLEGA